MLMSAKSNEHQPEQKLNGDQNYANVPNNYQQHQVYQVETDYRKSMPDLQYILVSL